MHDYSMMPLGTVTTVNGNDQTLMTHLCRYGWWPVRYLSGGMVEVRRDFWKLLTQQESVEQSDPSEESKWPQLTAVRGWLSKAGRHLAKQVADNIVGAIVSAMLAALVLWLTRLGIKF